MKKRELETVMNNMGGHGQAAGDSKRQKGLCSIGEEDAFFKKNIKVDM